MFNGGGIYNIPVTFVSGTPIKSQEMNDTFQDFKLGFQKCLTTDGQTKPTTNIDWNNKKIINMADGTSDKDAATFGQARRVVIFYIDQVNGLDSNNGLTLTTPFKSIKKAVDSCPNQGYGVIYILGAEDEIYTLQVTDKCRPRSALVFYPLHRTTGLIRNGGIDVPWTANQDNEYNINYFGFTEETPSIMSITTFHIKILAEPVGVTLESTVYLGLFSGNLGGKRSLQQLNLHNSFIENLSINGKLFASDRGCIALTVSGVTHTGMAGKWINGIPSGTAPKDTGRVLSNLATL